MTQGNWAAEWQQILVALIHDITLIALLPRFTYQSSAFIWITRLPQLMEYSELWNAENLWFMNFIGGLTQVIVSPWSSMGVGVKGVKTPLKGLRKYCLGQIMSREMGIPGVWWERSWCILPFGWPSGTLLMFYNTILIHNTWSNGALLIFFYRILY